MEIFLFLTVVVYERGGLCRKPHFYCISIFVIKTNFFSKLVINTPLLYAIDDRTFKK